MTEIEEHNNISQGAARRRGHATFRKAVVDLSSACVECGVVLRGDGPAAGGRYLVCNCKDYLWYSNAGEWVRIDPVERVVHLESRRPRARQ